MRWKEPRALAAADQTAPRAHQRRGRQTVRRRVSGECAGHGPAGGSLIPHAGAIRPLMIPMIEAAFRAAAVSPARSADRTAAARGATDRRAVRVTAITGDTDREDPVTASAGFLTERSIHGVGAAVRSDWTYSPNRGTTDRTASACRSPRLSRGPGGSVRALTLSLLTAYPNAPSTRQRRGHGRWRAYGRTDRAHSRLEISRRTRDSHTAHRHPLFLITRPDRKDPAREVQISTFLRGYQHARNVRAR